MKLPIDSDYSVPLKLYFLFCAKCQHSQN